LGLYDFGLARVPKGVLSIDGERVAFQKAGWEFSNPEDPTQSFAFHSGVWLLPMMAERPQRVVDLLVDQASASPDPMADDALVAPGAVDKDVLRAAGWVEGQVTLRMRTVNCAFDLTGDRRLRPVMKALVKANLDPERYYGPPKRAAHNHGLLANQALRRAGELFNRPQWVARSQERSAELSAGYWSECGMTKEQATSYHVYNLNLWEQEVEYLSGDVADRVYADIEKARSALAALARPDGQLEAIGESWRIADVSERPGGWLWCPFEDGGGGWAAAHTESPGFSQHHTVRFGPGPRFHGTPDHGSPTWFVQTGQGSVAVVSDPGRFGTERDQRWDWMHSPSGASTFERVGAPLIGGTTGVRSFDDWHLRYTLTTALKGGTQERELTFGRQAPVLVVADTFTPAPGEEWIENTFRQHWILAPGWQPAKGHTARNGDHRLSLVCLAESGPMPAAQQWVEFYPEHGSVERALEVYCQSTATGSTEMTAILLVDQDVPTVTVQSIQTDQVTVGLETSPAQITGL